MRFDKQSVVFQEVPDEISLAFTITGCVLRCAGCHSPHLRLDMGTPLTEELFSEIVDEHLGYVSCVLFMGGEQDKRTLIKLLKIARDKGLKTCLYSGLNMVGKSILEHLDYVKLGCWMSHLGGLDSKTTNQRFYKVGEDLSLTDMTYKFWSKND